LDTGHEAVLNHPYNFPEIPGKSDNFQNFHRGNMTSDSLNMLKAHTL